MNELLVNTQVCTWNLLSGASISIRPPQIRSKALNKFDWTDWVFFFALWCRGCDFTFGEKCVYIRKNYKIKPPKDHEVGVKIRKIKTPLKGPKMSKFYFVSLTSDGNADGKSKWLTTGWIWSLWRTWQCYRVTVSYGNPELFIRRCFKHLWHDTVRGRIIQTLFSKWFGEVGVNSLKGTNLSWLLFYWLRGDPDS